MLPNWSLWMQSKLAQTTSIPTPKLRWPSSFSLQILVPLSSHKARLLELPLQINYQPQVEINPKHCWSWIVVDIGVLPHVGKHPPLVILHTHCNLHIVLVYGCKFSISLWCFYPSQILVAKDCVASNCIAYRCICLGFGIDIINVWVGIVWGLSVFEGLWLISSMFAALVYVGPFDFIVKIFWFNLFGGVRTYTMIMCTTCPSWTIDQ